MQTLFDYTDLNDKVVQLGEELLARKNSKQPYYEAQVQMYKGLGILYGAYKKDQLLTTLNLAKTELEKVPSDYPNYPNVEVHLNLVWVYSLLKDKENTYNNILRSAQLAERQEDKKMLMLMLGKLNEEPEFFFQGIEMVWGKPK